ncbi:MULTISPECIES: hypothetical protein [Nocardia]|jgi:hypothetical protein|uniref:Uncharacterized protein n=1 Tax=Nocardia gamkensis TaxID=352869 RepID=A0A7X6L6X5_9NOCA|nr:MULTISPECIES: hypothetical protein [Nocardia]NKY28981.1 hypothetical protein [Nocardia gamkensis]NQE66313.1 hypothetical protein [Nocardia gamkensis]
MPAELAVTLIVMAAVGGLLILVFWVLPWLLDLGGEPDESVSAREIFARLEDEQR